MELMMLDLYTYNRDTSAWAECLRFRDGYWKAKERQSPDIDQMPA